MNFSNLRMHWKPSSITLSSACRLAVRVMFLHMAVMATVVMCRVRNPACTAESALGKERYINGRREAPLTLCIWHYINELQLQYFCEITQIISITCFASKMKWGSCNQSLVYPFLTQDPFMTQDPYYDHKQLQGRFSYCQHRDISQHESPKMIVRNVVNVKFVPV